MLAIVDSGKVRVGFGRWMREELRTASYASIER